MDDTKTSSESAEPSSTITEIPVDVGNTTHLPESNTWCHQTVSLVAKSGETLTIDRQIQFYAPNNLLGHPLISPALSYLGGLPPLLFIASDKEVLRDEIIYT
jgi:acetyl esterase/lipase